MGISKKVCSSIGAPTIIQVATESRDHGSGTNEDYHSKLPVGRYGYDMCT